MPTQTPIRKKVPAPRRASVPAPRTADTQTFWVPFGGHAKPVKPDPLLHGGKAASLLEMTRAGLRVPPGCILTTEVFRMRNEDRKRADQIIEEAIQIGIAHIEQASGKSFARGTVPLLLSVRSGAPVSMPGMMDTILNVGLSDGIIEGMAGTMGERFAWGSYLRLIAQMAPLIVPAGTSSDVLDHLLDFSRPLESALEAKERCLRALTHLTTMGYPFPQNPFDQLRLAIHAVFDSWNSRRCRVYRELHSLPSSLGTACTLQAMIFGNLNEKSGTGVCFSRDPSTGEKRLTGEYLPVAQGDDVVAGIRTPFPLAIEDAGRESDRAHTLEGQSRALYRELQSAVEEREDAFHSVLDIEFTVEDSVLYFLQCRSAKLSAHAAVSSLLDFYQEGHLTARAIAGRVTGKQISQLLKPGFDHASEKAAEKEGRLLATGLPAGPGVAVGQIILEASRAPADTPWILVRSQTSPEDVPDMVKAAGVLTSHGGMSSHASLVARQMGITCVTGCEAVRGDPQNHAIHIGSKTLKEGDILSIDGSTGKVYEGEIPFSGAQNGSLLIERLLTITDPLATLSVFANADTAEQATTARAFGARGIGLVRTEHMFFGTDRLPLIQRLILAEDDRSRTGAIAELEVLQTNDFEALLAVMDGLPVTVRTIDPPLHEFLPHEQGIDAAAEKLHMSPEKIRQSVHALREENPMLGLRGCRLGILHPEIPLMQVRALLRAACTLKKRGMDPQPSIMIPLTSGSEELHVHRLALEREIERILAENAVSIPCPIGTMIEVPRAALLAREVAKEADFFSFGTNDLTQMVFALSRDDAASFLPVYIAQGIYPSDPFATLDRKGVGALMRMAVTEARAIKPGMKIGICGEHGGDPASIAFCASLGLDYVSCSPMRVPVARLAAAQSEGLGT
ncbi:MAG: pyruvate, phosphate dikinase [Candidatus Peregrinibacteria bacterium]